MEKQKRSFLQSPFLKVGAGLLFVVLLVLLFLPQISSTSWVSVKIKQAINEKVPGNLDYSHLTISWLNGLQINDLVYDDKTNGTYLTIDEISTSKGLLALATNYKDGGIINITKPQAVLYLQEKSEDTSIGSQPTVTDLKKKQTKADTQEQTASQKDKSTDSQPLLPPVDVELHISNGTLVTVSPDNSKKPVLENFNLQLNLDVPIGIVDYQLSFQDASGAGKVKGDGKITLPVNTTTDLNSLASNAILEITDWQIADMLDIAAYQGNAPLGEGVINGSLHISSNENATIGITGNIKGHKIKLHSGPLKSDTPAINDIAIDFDVQKNGADLEVKNVDIHSLFIEGVLAGSSSNKQLQTLSTSAQINVAEILSQFPDTLNLQEGVRVSKGIIDIKADATSSGSSTAFEGKIHLNQLTGTTGKKNISWEKPVDVIVQGNLKDKAMTLDKLAVESSFLQANGSGDAGAMQLQVTADIGTALKELGKFVQLEGWASKGKLDLDLGISSTSKDIRDITGNLKVANFELVHDKTIISPTDTFTAAITSSVELTPEMEPLQLSNTTIDITSWLGSGTMTAENFILKTKTTPALLKKGVTKTTFNLERVTALLHSLKTLPQEQTFTGILDLSANMDGNQSEKSSINLQANISPFTFTSGDKVLTEDKISVAVKATADTAKQNFTITDLNLSSDPLTLTASGSMKSEGKEQVVDAKGTTQLDFNSLSKTLKSFADLQLEMKGVSENPFNFSANTSEGKWKQPAQHAEFSSALDVDKIRGYGVEIESLKLPIDLKKSHAEIGLTALVNKGELTVKPKFDFTGSSPVITLPDNSTILKDVGLTGEMSNDLLAKVHPLFKGVASSVGTISLDMERFNWPMDKELQKEATFVGALTFNDVKLQAGALLTPLLAIMKTEENEIQISDQPMTFIGENERVTCSPLKATVNTYSLILEGSIGFDQSLDYIAKIPVTRKMVSSDVYKYLEGTYISVPLTGTVSKPSVSKSVVQKALGDLILQAGKKQLGDQAGKILKKLFK